MTVSRCAFWIHVVATMHRLPQRSYLSYEILVHNFGATVYRYNNSCIDSDGLITHHELVFFFEFFGSCTIGDCSASDFIHFKGRCVAA